MHCRTSWAATRPPLARCPANIRSLPPTRFRRAGAQLIFFHQAFLKDIDAIGAQVEQIEGDAKRLRDAYAGERAMEISGREQEVMKVRRR